MMVDEFDGDDYELRAVVDAAQTPPFLSDKRVVVARGVGRFLTDEVAPLVAYVGNPLDTTDLVLVAGGGKVAKKLADAVKADGTVDEHVAADAGEGPPGLGRRSHLGRRAAGASPMPRRSWRSGWARTSAGSTGSSPRCTAPTAATTR